MKPLSLTVPVTIRAAEGDSPVRRFEMVAYTGEPMRIDGFPLPVVIDCASLDTSVQELPALFNHGADCPVGQIQSVTCDGSPPIRAAGVFTPSGLSDDRAAEVINRADAGYRWQVSIGGNPASVEQYQRGESFTANGRQYTGPAMLAKGVRLREISFVTIGGDSLTSAVVAGSTPTLRGSAMDFETWVTSLGFVPADLTEQQRAAMTIQFNEIYGEEEAETPAEMPVTAEDGMVKPEDQLPANAGAKPPVIQASNHAEVQAEAQRITAIQAAAKKYGSPTMTINGNRVEVAAHAIAEGWTPAQAEIQAMRSQLRTPPPQLRVTPGGTIQALTAGLMIKCGVALDNPAFGRARGGELFKHAPWLQAGINDPNRNRIMDAGHRFADMSALDLAKEAIRCSGGQVYSSRTETIRAAFSTPSFNNVITTSMNAMLMSKYVEAADTTGGWVIETDVANYLTQERSRVTATKGLTRQPEGAEADHIAPDDLKETYKVARYGSQLVVDEIAIVNDSLGAFAEEAGAMGLAAARLRPDLVYATLLANPTLATTSLSLFSASNETANLLTSSALSASTLATARKTMALVRENGVNLGLVLSHLIVPPALGDTAYNLVSSQLQLIASAGTTDVARTTGELNALKRHNFTLVEEPRLENGVIHPETGTSYSGSATTWFAASSMAPSLEVGYLQGTGRSPQSRTWQLTGGSYGVGWAVKHVIGICPRDWRGLQKATA